MHPRASPWSLPRLAGLCSDVIIDWNDSARRGPRGPEVAPAAGTSWAVLAACASSGDASSTCFRHIYYVCVFRGHGTAVAFARLQCMNLCVHCEVLQPPAAAVTRGTDWHCCNGLDWMLIMMSDNCYHRQLESSSNLAFTCWLYKHAFHNQQYCCQ